MSGKVDFNEIVKIRKERGLVKEEIVEKWKPVIDMTDEIMEGFAEMLKKNISVKKFKYYLTVKQCETGFNFEKFNLKESKKIECMYKSILVEAKKNTYCLNNFEEYIKSILYEKMTDISDAFELSISYKIFQVINPKYKLENYSIIVFFLKD